MPSFPSLLSFVTSVPHFPGVPLQLRLALLSRASASISFSYFLSLVIFVSKKTQLLIIITSSQHHRYLKMLHLLPLILLSSVALASPISPEAANGGAAAASTPGKPASEGVTTLDGVPLAGIPVAPAPEDVITSDASISQAGWTVTADSAQDGNPATDAIDGDTTTFWHTEFSPDLVQLPHNIVIDMGASYLVGSITYLPRQDGGSNGNIGQHVVQLR